MLRHFTLLFLLSATLFGTLSAGAAERFKSISLTEVDALLAQKGKVFIYDANVESTRQNVGIVPGAQLLDSSSNYDTKKFLPADKASKLVFYCANPMCTASHHAADRALDAGYTDVSVMKDGIYGWKKAGKALAKAAAALAAPETSAAATAPVETQSITAKQASEMAKSGQAVIIDVRENEERHEIVEGSLAIPMSKVSDTKAWNDFKAQLPKGKAPIFHCAGGYRSKKVAEKLTAEGTKSLYFKGPDQWKSEGLPLAKGPAK